MERAYKRYLLIKQITEFIKPYKLKQTELVQATLWKALYLLDSYNDIEMIKDILSVRFTTKDLISNKNELEYILKKYLDLYQNEHKIVVPKLEIGDFDVSDKVTITINNDIFKITTCAYEMYKFADKMAIVNGILFYHHDFIRLDKRYSSTDLISEIIDKLEPKNVTEICPNFVEASTLEIKDKFKKVNFNLHTFNVSVNKPFGATAHYLSDIFADNSIIYLSSIPDFNMGMHLLTVVFPYVLKKYKNICIVMINRFYYYHNLIEIIKKLSYVQYQISLDIDSKDIITCQKIKTYKRIYGFIACSDDVSEAKFKTIKNIFTKYQYKDKEYNE